MLGTKFLAGVWGKAPSRVWGGNPIVTPNREAIKKQESGSEAKPDSEQVTLNRPLHTPSTCLGYALRGIGYALRGLGLRACDAGGGTRSAGQGEIGGFRFPPLFPLTPSPLETSRDTLHPGTGATTRTNRPAGRVRGMGLRGYGGFKAACSESGDASLPDSCFFMNRFAILGTKGYAWGFAPNPSKELRSLHPLFASRRLKATNKKSPSRS